MDIGKAKIQRNQRALFRVAYGYNFRIGNAAEIFIGYGQNIIACLLEQICNLDGQVLVDFKLHVEILSGRHVHEPLASEVGRVPSSCLHGLTAKTWVALQDLIPS